MVKKIHSHICEICGKEFQSFSAKSMYCSDSCRRQASLIRYKGLERIKERQVKLSSRKNDILPQYDFKCAICGWSIPKSIVKFKNHQAGCEIHHITPVCEGGSEDQDNLILLCPNCHKMAHYGLYSKDFLRQHIIIWSKQDYEKYKLDELCRAAELIDDIF